MATGQNSCLVCGGTEFEDDNGMYYCVVCQTKLEGMVVINYEKEFISQQASHVMTIGGQTEPTARGTGYLWSTWEAFNIILVEQCKFLVRKLGLDPQLQQVVFALWVNYLNKIEVAFIKDEPKLSIGASRRDILSFAYNSDTITSIKYREGRGRSTNCPSRDLVSKRLVNPELVSNEVCPSTRRSKESYRYLGINKAVESLLFGEAKIEDIDVDSRDVDDYLDGEDSKFSQYLEPEILLLSEAQKATTIPEDRMNKFSHEVSQKIAKGELEQYEPKSLLCKMIDLDRMSMTTTLAFILISFRLMRLDIHTCDVLNWVDTGRLPFYNALRLLPDSWTRLQCDRLFSPRSSPSSDAVNLKVSNICKFLNLLPLPPVDLQLLMKRMLHEMNLPISLHVVIFDNPFLLNRFNYIFRDRPRLKQCVPRYEIKVLMVILVILNKFYILDDEEQLAKQCSGCPHYKKTYNRFDALFWMQYTRARTKALRLRFTPLWKERVTSVHDTDVAHQFYEQFVTDWKQNFTHTGRHSRHSEEAFRDKMKQLLSSVSREPESFIQFPQASMPCLFLSDATAFAATREKKSPYRDILSLDFRRKSIAYLVKGRNFNRRHYQPINERDPSTLPEIVNWYLQLVSWLVHEEREKLLLHLRYVERIMFGTKDHRPARCASSLSTASINVED